jgi:NADH:ubiquinone oxidoreductase subunit K
VTDVRAFAVVATIVFGIGVYGALARRHAVAVIIAIELMLNAAVLNFVSFSRIAAPGSAVSGQVFAVFIITVAAAEAIVALALVLALHRALKTARLDRFTLLKW